MPTDEAVAAVWKAWSDAGLLTDDDFRLAYTRRVRAYDFAVIAAAALDV